MLGNFVFDLDGAIVIALDYNVEATEKDVREKFDDDFIDKHSVMAYNYKHYVFPGYYALFRWLHNNGGKLFFFSAGIEARNTELVENLMKKTFGDEYQNVDYKVFSRKDCVDTERMDSEKSKLYQSYFFGNYKKKLADIIVPKEELENTLLIDDDTSYMVKGEEYNFVHVRGTSHYMPYSFSKEYVHFLPAYYLAGLFAKIFETQAEKQMTLIQAAKYVQIDSEGKVLNRDFYYHGYYRPEYYVNGYEILKKIDNSLKIYYEIPTEMPKIW